MIELVEYLAKALTSNPVAVVVTEEIVDGRVTIRLEVAPEDKGKIIGRQGRVAQAIRLLVRASATKNGTHAMLEIV